MRFWKIVLIILTFSGVAKSHDLAPEWLKSDQLENGIYVAVDSPWVIRKSGVFPLSVKVLNVCSDREVRLNEIRVIGCDGIATAKVYGQTLASYMHEYGQAIASRLAMSVADKQRDRVGMQNAHDSFGEAIGIIRESAVISKWTLSTDSIPTAIEVDLFEDGVQKIIRKQIDTKFESPLPRGGAAAVVVSFDENCEPVVSEPRSSTTSLWWFAGDQHIHTSFSVDAVILDGTEEEPYEYSQGAEAIGLDWAIFTDHSNITYSEVWGDRDWYVSSQFDWGQSECQQYRADHNWLSIYSQEMGLGQQGFWDLASHMLCLPLKNDLAGMLQNPSDGLVYGHANCESEQTIINRINNAGAFGFIAHPYDWEYLAFYEWDWGNGTNGWAGMELICANDGSYSSEDWSSWYKWHELLGGIGSPMNGELPDRAGWPNKFPVGIGNSDAHVPGDVGRCWTYVAMPEVTRANLHTAMLSGKCIPSNGPLAWVIVNGSITGDVALVPEGWSNTVVSVRTNSSMGYAGDYTVHVLVDGAIRHTIEPSGLPYYSLDFNLPDLNLTSSDHFITLRAENGGLVSMANPIWLQH
ncbi:MAG: PHP-associated domain-containing protein, partial [Phycisphaerales bacterium]|nr:PHP-associated domain-containing protein [Phycisphaerales bacterium]